MSAKTLSTLSLELFDFLGLGRDFDLPELDSVSLKRSVRDSSWECTAYTQQKDAGAAVEAVYAYARYAGGVVDMHTPYVSSVQPSGWQMSLWTHIEIAGVRIKVLAILDADAYAEAMAEEAPGDCDGFVVPQESVYSDPAVRAAVRAVASGGAR